MIRYSQVLKKPIIVILLMQFVSFEVYCRGLTEEEEIAKIIEKRKEWLIKNAIATSAIDFEYTGSSDHNRRGLKSGSYYYYLGNTEYRGEVLVNDKTCFINGTTPCAGSIGDSDYIVPLIHFDGHYSSPDGTASKQVSTYMSPSEVIGSSGPVIEREQSFAVKIDPLSWFLVFDCSSVNEQINCETARRRGEERRGNYFYIQSDEIGRIDHSC